MYKALIIIKHFQKGVFWFQYGYILSIQDPNLSIEKKIYFYIFYLIVCAWEFIYYLFIYFFSKN
jgi:hypothetical protein